LGRATSLITWARVGESQVCSLLVIGFDRYRAPETIGCGTEYSYPSDIWSLGCTLAEFISGDALFQVTSFLLCPPHPIPPPPPPLQGETEQDVVDSIVSLFPDNQIPSKFYAHCSESNLAVR
jgi:serine/threonine protein kinase